MRIWRGFGIGLGVRRASSCCRPCLRSVTSNTASEWGRVIAPETSSCLFEVVPMMLAAEEGIETLDPLNSLRSKSQNTLAPVIGIN